MSRAFVSDKEDWNYCPKAGERCMHAEPGKDCRNNTCEWFHASPPKAESAGSKSARNHGGLQVVSRKPAAGKGNDAGGKAGPARKTKRANIPMPRKWGGRSGGF